jgi:K+/H+ antiporter YhaU regulatory subunit KhtT
MPSLLENASLITVPIAAGAPALGKQIRELELRTRTGATAVAVRRGTETVISPEPDFEFQLHDEVLLIGDQRQLAEARMLFLSQRAQRLQVADDHSAKPTTDA